LYALNEMRLAHGGLVRRFAGGGAVNDPFDLVDNNIGTAIFLRGPQPGGTGGFPITRQYLEHLRDELRLRRQLLAHDLRAAQKREESLRKDLENAKRVRDSWLDAMNEIADTVRDKFAPN